MNHKVIAALASLLVAATAHGAGIRKCKDPTTGKVIYTDHICPKRGKQMDLEIHDSHVGSLPSGLVRPFTPSSHERTPSSTPSESPSSSSSSSNSSPSIHSGY